jgi:type IV pilus assembly protein PilZ
MGDDEDERRHHPRAPIELLVEYQRLNAFFADYTRNIGRGGTFVQTERPLPIGTEFVFNLAVPTLDAPIRLSGRVQWTVTAEQATADQPSGMGIGFLFANDSERELVERTVVTLMNESLGPALSERLLRLRDSRPPGDD